MLRAIWLQWFLQLNTHVLLFSEELYGVEATFSTHSALLHAAKRGA